MLRTALTVSPQSVAIIGGARGTNEDAFAWAQLADALGVDSRDSQLADGLPPQVFALPQATIADIDTAKTIILLAPDLKEELPILYLRVRHAAEKRTGRVVEVSPRATGLAGKAWKKVHVEPGKTAAALRALATDAVFMAQLASGSVVVIVGRMNLAESEESVVHALAEVLHMAPHATVLPALRRGNVRGAITAGLTPRNGGKSTAEILEAAAAGKIECLVLLGADPLSDVPDADLARRGISGARNIIAIDTFITQSSALADIVLPAAAYGEKVGTTTNIEGRISNVAQSITPVGTSRPDWMIAVELGAATAHDLGFSSYNEVHSAMISRVSEFAPAIDTHAVEHDGVIVAHPTPITLTRADGASNERNSYDYRAVVSRKLYDNAIGTAKSQSLATLGISAAVIVNPLDVPRIGAQVGESVRVTSQRATLVLPLQESVDVLRGTAWLPINLSGSDARELLDVTKDVIDLKIEKMS
jgi:NADH-quinone oxidoreductase subunit G